MDRPLNRFSDSVFPARLTAKELVDGRWLYSWEELIPEAGTADLVAAQPPRRGAPRSGEARELNNVDVNVAGKPAVWLRFRAQDAGAVYEFLAPAADGDEGSGSGPSVPVWLVTNVCPVFDDEVGSGSGTGGAGTGNYIRVGDPVSGDLAGVFPDLTLPRVRGGTF